MKRLASQGARGASVRWELLSKPLVPENNKPRKVEETCKQRREEISRKVAITSAFNALYQLRLLH